MSYFMRDGYQDRAVPEYAHDGESYGFQPHVYELAAYMARITRSDSIVDIGCGAGEKLKPFADEYEIIGIDHGLNLAIAQERIPSGRFIDVDLETFDAEKVFIPRDSVVICSDVIEHLVNPDPLVDGLALWCRQRASLAILSTPERVLCHGHEHNGPPLNSTHVREWTRVELLAYLTSRGLRPVFSGFTQTHVAHPETGWHQGCQTTIVVLEGIR